MSEFTKEQLRGLPAETPMYYGSDGDWHYATKTDLAAFALAMMEERDQARRELEEAEEAICSILSLPQCQPITGEAVSCVACGQRKAPIGRDAPSILYLCSHECPGYKADPRPGFLWPGETLEEFGYPEESARADGDLRVALQHPAVLRARERGKVAP